MRPTDALFLIVIIGLIVACVAAYLLERYRFNKRKKGRIDNINKAAEAIDDYVSKKKENCNEQ